MNCWIWAASRFVVIMVILLSIKDICSIYLFLSSVIILFILLLFPIFPKI